MQNINEFGQPIGEAIKHFKVPPRPNFNVLKGNAATIIPISKDHLSALHAAFMHDKDGRNWTYLPYGPFKLERDFKAWAENLCFGEDPKFFTIFNSAGPAGFVGYLNIQPQVGCIEVGHVHLSPLLQRTRAGTEALLLMIEWAFEAGYRRVEWKCDSLNSPSRHAAQRLGFSYEGTFRQALIYKSRNRDTTWFAATNKDWPALKQAYHAWLNPENFDAQDKELKKLSELTAGALVHIDR